MILSLAVTIGFRDTKRLGNASVKPERIPKMQEAAIDLTLNKKKIVLSALRFAMSIETLKNSPDLAHELKTSDEEVRLLVTEEEVKSVVRLGISNVISKLLDEICFFSFLNVL